MFVLFHASSYLITCTELSTYQVVFGQRKWHKKNYVCKQSPTSDTVELTE